VGSFLRAFTFGHVRQLDAVATRVLSGLAATTPVLAGIDDRVLVDVDEDPVIEVHGYGKQGSGYGYSGVRGLNALLATVTTTQAAPVIAAQRLRKSGLRITPGRAPPGRRRPGRREPAALHPGDRHGEKGPPPCRLRVLRAPHRGCLHPGRCRCVGHRPTEPQGQKAIAGIGDDAWQPIAYTGAVFDETTGVWVSRAEVAAIPFTAFT
jgi:hypothetical protein